MQTIECTETDKLVVGNAVWNSTINSFEIRNYRCKITTLNGQLVVFVKAVKQGYWMGLCKFSDDKDVLEIFYPNSKTLKDVESTKLIKPLPGAKNFFSINGTELIKKIKQNEVTVNEIFSSEPILRLTRIGGDKTKVSGKTRVSGTSSENDTAKTAIKSPE